MKDNFKEHLAFNKMIDNAIEAELGFASTYKKADNQFSDPNRLRNSLNPYNPNEDPEKTYGNEFSPYVQTTKGFWVLKDADGDVREILWPNGKPYDVVEYIDYDVPVPSTGENKSIMQQLRYDEHGQPTDDHTELDIGEEIPTRRATKTADNEFQNPLGEMYHEDAGDFDRYIEGLRARVPEIAQFVKTIPPYDIQGGKDPVEIFIRQDLENMIQGGQQWQMQMYDVLITMLPQLVQAVYGMMGTIASRAAYGDFDDMETPPPGKGLVDPSGNPLSAEPPTPSAPQKTVFKDLKKAPAGIKGIDGHVPTPEIQEEFNKLQSVRGTMAKITADIQAAQMKFNEKVTELKQKGGYSDLLIQQSQAVKAVADLIEQLDPKLINFGDTAAYVDTKIQQNFSPDTSWKLKQLLAKFGDQALRHLEEAARAASETAGTTPVRQLTKFPIKGQSSITLNAGFMDSLGRLADILGGFLTVLDTSQAELMQLDDEVAPGLEPAY